MSSTGVRDHRRLNDRAHWDEINPPRTAPPTETSTRTLSVETALAGPARAPAVLPGSEPGPARQRPRSGLFGGP